MTVQELIDALMAVEDKDKLVDVEGCDCINPATGVDPNWNRFDPNWHGRVLIKARS